jgi:hypothetical protein
MSDTVNAVRLASTEPDQAHVPDADPKASCDDRSQWCPRVHGRVLGVAPDKKVRVKDRKRRFTDFSSRQSYVRRTLLGDRVRARCAIDETKVETLLAQDSLSITPTYVVTWSELALGVPVACDRSGLRSMKDAATRLGDMALGKADPLRY